MQPRRQRTRYLLRALSSGELLEDLKRAEPLAPAFIRGIEAKRRLIDENGGAFTAEQVAESLVRLSTNAGVPGN